MNDIKILYTGGILTGRESSLRIIGSKSIPVFDVRSEPLGGWKCFWKIDEKLYKLNISKTRFRTWKYYEEITEILTDYRAETEINFLKQVDGLIFVIDSQFDEVEIGAMFLNQTYKDFIHLGRLPSKIPIVFQLNKRDLPETRSRNDLIKYLNWPVCDFIETVAITGQGVTDSLNRLIKLVEQTKDQDLSIRQNKLRDIQLWGINL